MYRWFIQLACGHLLPVRGLFIGLQSYYHSISLVYVTDMCHVFWDYPEMIHSRFSHMISCMRCMYNEPSCADSHGCSPLRGSLNLLLERRGGPCHTIQIPYNAVPCRIANWNVQKWSINMPNMHVNNTQWVRNVDKKQRKYHGYKSTHLMHKHWNARHLMCLAQLMWDCCMCWMRMVSTNMKR